MTVYLLRSIPTGLWIGKFFCHANLRERGNGDTGTTNTFRVLGPKAGTVTFIIDMLKGAVVILLPHILGVTVASPISIGLFAIIGHTFLIFAKSRDGETVATSAGVFLGFVPTFLFYLLITFVETLYPFGIVSLSSVVATAVAVTSVLIFPAFGFLLSHYDLPFTLIIVLIAGIIIIRHRNNITCTRKHEENLIPWGLNLNERGVD